MTGQEAKAAVSRKQSDTDVHRSDAAAYWANRAYEGRLLTDREKAVIKARGGSLPDNEKQLKAWLVDADRGLPSEGEIGICGSILKAPPTITEARLLRPADFIDEHCTAFFSVASDFHRRGLPLDPLAMAGELAGKPPFTSKVDVAEFFAELETKVVTSAHAAYYAGLVAESSRKRRLLALGENVCESARNGQASSTIINDLMASAIDFQRESSGERQRFTPITAAELDSGKYDLTYLVDWLLTEGQPCILAGPKKSLKTSLLVDLGITIATGGAFLNKFQCRDAKRFLLCSGESGLATLQETARRVARSKGWELADIPNFTITPDLPRLDDADHLADFEQFLESQGAEVVAIDPAYLCMPGDDASNLFKQGVLLRSITELCQRQGVTLILAHHTRKRGKQDSGYEVPELDDIAWSGFAEFARQWLLVGRREAYEPGTGDHRLWLSVGGSAGHGGLYALNVAEGTATNPGGRQWEVAISNATEAKEQNQKRREDRHQQEQEKLLHDDRQAVCRALAKSPAGLSKTQLRDRSTVSWRRFPAVLATMIEAGEVAECEVTISNKKKPIDGYKLIVKEIT